ncbi:transcription factor EGL1-like [Gastrolobium bilobum]|uniref:transcription factor EGL1-like n=1 Tax=Gastrolobium bilobum TaxID=150636 RepID=UPI002AB12CF7|nr:transcription factor EGL1-like [Gastrolobium bilobum]
MVPENMKKQLALALRSIQWSYAIFWSSSATQPGVLSWGEGYYNGDIKTRKTSQGVELNSDQIGLQRSEQLRELFKSLKTAETSPQTKRPSAALSPEDLTDTEWYYLVCMSFVFNIGKGLPGRALANGQPIWLNNANSTDCRVFSRSLLAKSASIQTVACFPFMEGVIELGTTDLVSEDLSILQRIRTSFLNILYVNVPNKSGATLKSRNEEDIACVAFDHNAYDVESIPEVGYEVINTASPNGSSNALQANQAPDETCMVEKINGGTSQFQSWQVMDDELSNCVPNSMNSSDCISQTFASYEKIASASMGENPSDPCARDIQKCNNPKMTLVDPLSDDRHYQRVLSSILKTSDQLIMGMHFQNSHRESSFASWKKGGAIDYQRPRAGTSQNLLKKVVFEVPRMHLDGLLESQEENDYKEGMRLEGDEIGMNHVMSERRRRAKLNERFLTLRSMVPSISKDDKVSILDDAIEYLRKLEKRIGELEARRELIDMETRTKKSPQDLEERTSDQYFNKTNNGKKSVIKKRKACEIDETGLEINSDAFRGSSTKDITVNMSDNKVVIEMKCPSRAGRLLEIMEAVNSLSIDFNSVQSTEADGNLFLTIKSKFTGSTVATAKRIKQTLQKVASKC